MRTLIISDLHLGNRARLDVLRLPGPRARLLEALDGVDRLVLLGDTVELFTRQPQRSMMAAEPVLREIGTRLGAEREVMVVGGNHDAALLRSWVLDRGERLRPSDAVDPAATPALARLTSWLAPARVTVHYPGVWLDDRVWATHGHYLDRHLLPTSAFGLPRGRLRSGPVSRARPVDYERARRRRRRRRGERSRESLLARFAARPVATLLESAAELARQVAMPQLPTLMMNARLSPVTAGLIDFQMRHASLAAMAHVARRLGIDADWVIFGHVHRNGPLDGDRWPRDQPRLANTGSWMYEPLLVDRATPPHPYWPGGAVLLETGREPRALGLLDGLGPEDLIAHA